MTYRSVDEVQKILTRDVFNHAADPKKAAGRSLGTIIEIITYYLLRHWGFGSYTTIEHRLPEFANSRIVHNVEFAINPLLEERIVDVPRSNIPLTTKKFLRACEAEDILRFSGINNKNVISKVGDFVVLNNSSKLAYDVATRRIAIATILGDQTKISILLDRPFAIFECKRVGIEEGANKGPTTIEKAKQGAYVALHASSFQKIRGRDGKIYGVIPKDDGKFDIKPFEEGLKYYVEKAPPVELADFVLTVGIVSNHGNWFTSGNQNKEMMVLSQSYDWLLFLTDQALSQFVEELMLNERKGNHVRDAFLYSYTRDSNGERRRNILTKVNMEINAAQQIERYISSNINSINKNWFNVISPENGSIEKMVKELRTLANRKWASFS